MREGQVCVLFGKVQKVEKLKNGICWRVLLIDLTTEVGNPIIDYIWVDLPRDFDQNKIKIQSVLRFAATVKSYRSRNYYDYHERETVQLRPICELTNLSNILLD